MMAKELLKRAEDRMKMAVQALRGEFGTVRTGRASVSILDKVNVDYFGTATPINQLASISAPEPRLLTIQPWDKSIINDIEKAITKSNLGFNPSNDGTLIRIPMPSLTEERRKELVKVVKGMAEESRVSVRNIRRDTNEHIKSMEKDGDISEDDFRRVQSEVQKLTDRYIAEIDKMLKHKEDEIMEV
ncbi:ribosome recycling factor [Candidatus Oleimmundimicrobium sp.]|uniref:ribosome recycling factor n=1 Tax=Candidatus Oleimmundimicrobium sp. TaxID=3060597 RepID=UPI002726F598|nr:ribosome recycling factor [Candidatus Oleimmundimicrobium sp.]MDO8886484.1 ribosome recycling factor [Candidatus Oleimmundimicrobium sp.]